MNKQAFLHGFQTRLALLEKQADGPPFPQGVKAVGAPPVGAAEADVPEDQWGEAEALGRHVWNGLSGAQSTNKNVPGAVNAVRRGVQGVGGAFRAAVHPVQTTLRAGRALGRLAGFGEAVAPTPAPPALSLAQRFVPRLANSGAGRLLGRVGNFAGGAAGLWDLATSNNPVETDPSKNAVQGIWGASVAHPGHARAGFGGGTGVNRYANAQKKELGQAWQEVSDNPGVMNTLSALGQTVAPWHGLQVGADAASKGIAGAIHSYNQSDMDVAKEQYAGRAIPGAAQTGAAADNTEQAMAQDRIRRGVDQWGRPAPGGTAEDQKLVQYDNAGAADRQARGVDEWGRPVQQPAPQPQSVAQQVWPNAQGRAPQ